MARKVEFTPEQEELLASGSTHRALAEMFGIGIDPVRRWRREHKWERPPAVVGTGLYEEHSEDAKQLAELDLANDTIRQLKAQARRETKRSFGNERVLRSIEDALATVEPFQLPPFEPVLSMRRPGDSEPHHRQAALWSDWHYGETVDRDQMNGINEYSVAVAESRVTQLVRSMLKFKRVRPPLTGLDIWILGDMGSGKIHRLEETNEIPAAKQYVRVGYLIASAVRQLAPHYPDIHVAAIVGNHPRAENDPASKDSYNNGDWIAYELARALTADLANVTWDIPEGGMIVRTFAGKNFLLWHGDGLKGNTVSGVPWVALTRRVNALKESYATIGIRIDYVVVGHFHQRGIVPGVYMNSSLIGPNEYSLKYFGGGEAPKQVLLTFDEKRSRETDVSTISFEDQT